MTLNTTLQVFLFIQVFVAGILLAVAYRHARAHFSSQKTETQPESGAQPINAELGPEFQHHLIEISEAKYQSAVNQSAAQLQHQLASSGDEIKDLVNRLATEIVADEMQRYRTELAKMRERANIELAGTGAEIARHQEEIKAKMNSEMEAEKQVLIKQIDTKLADAVGSFLTETLQHNVDLGEQKEYLVSMLEEHKKDFVKGVADESKTTD